MNGSAAIAAAFSIVKAVAGVGPNIYDSLRYTNEQTVEGKFGQLFLDRTTDPDNPRIHTWMVTRESVRGADVFMQTGKATHAVVAVGYFGFVDGATEKLWQEEVDNVAAAFFPYAGRHLQSEGNDVQFDWSGPPQIEGIRIVWFGPFLCHTARIVVPVEELTL